MNIAEKLSLLKKSFQKEEKVKVVEKVVSEPLDFQKSFFQAFVGDDEALPEFASFYANLTTSKKKNVLANLEYYFLLAKKEGGLVGNERKKVDYSSTIHAISSSEKQGYSQAEFARILGVTNSAIASYIKLGKLEIDGRTISKNSILRYLESK